MFFFEVVFKKIGIAVAAKPKLLDKLFAFVVEFQLQKRAALFRRNYVGNIFRQPRFVGPRKAGKRLVFELLAILLINCLEALNCPGFSFSLVRHRLLCTTLRCRLLLGDDSVRPTESAHQDGTPDGQSMLVHFRPVNHQRFLAPALGCPIFSGKPLASRVFRN